MDCNSCKEKREQERPTISRAAFQSALTALERIIIRLWIVILILILLLAACAVVWIYCDATTEPTTETSSFFTTMSAPLGALFFYAILAQGKIFATFSTFLQKVLDIYVNVW